MSPFLSCMCARHFLLIIQKMIHMLHIDGYCISKLLARMKINLFENWMKKQTSLFCANHGQIHSNWSQRWKCFVCLCFSFSILAKVHKILKSVWKRNCVNRVGRKETLYVIEKDVTIKCSAPFWPFMTFLFHFSNVCLEKKYISHLEKG
jgi:hypothetical protein